VPHHKPLVPVHFQVPSRIVKDRFVMRPLLYSDAKPDYEAWHSSLDHLHGIFGPTSKWPDAGMTLEDNAIDLAWHQREHESASSFAYTVFDSGEKTCLGCVYISPSRKENFEAEIYYWVRASEAETGLESELGSFVRHWITAVWPFNAVVYPGRDISWKDFGALADREHW
jgi:RimJ/RimL family protein N-acetyltransferase